MDKTLLKHKNDIIDLVNTKIADIYKDVHHDGGEPVIDDEELIELYYCAKIMKALSQIRHSDHDMKMDMHEAGGSHTPRSTDHLTTNPHGYGSIPFTTM